MKHFRVRNWEKFQHYKDRNPPWIKLHTELLDNYEFSSLQDASKLLAMYIWLLAARSDNKIPADPEWIKGRANLKSTPDLQPLFDAKFIEWIQELPISEHDASDPLADRKQSDCSEERRDRGERETEAYGAEAPARTPPAEPKKRPSRRCPSDFAVDSDMRSWASTECPGLNIDHETKAFRDYEFRNAHNDWPATWRNWMRKAHENRTKRNGSHGPEIPTRRHKEFGQ